MRSTGLSIFLLLLGLPALAQRLPDTVILKEAVIVEPRAQSFSTGQKVQKVDSLWLKANQQNSLAEALEGSSHIFLKSYSPGGLVNTSLRGMAAPHTAIIWNGFNLQSPLNGQLELSLIPVFFIDDLEIQYGGAGAMWGSGAIGGSISMSNKPSFNQGLSLFLNNGIGSFGKLQQGLGIGYSDNRWSNSTRLFRLSSENDYRYRNSTKAGNPVERQQNAAIEQYGLLQENSLKLGKRQLLSLFAWYQFNDREIPPTLTTVRSQARQQDEFMRAGVQWQRKGKVADLSFRTAWLHDWLQYDDSSITLSSTTRATSIIAEVEAKWKLPKYLLLNLGINNTYTFANSLKIEDSEQERNRTSLFASYQKSNKKGTAKGSFSARQELIENKFAPIVPALGFEISLLKQIVLIHGNVGRTYRIPTFNDLYWQESAAHGNPELKPEKGWSSELGFFIKKQIQNWQYNFGATGFAIYTQNLIQWYPQGNIWQPVNRNRVLSRGIEGEAQLQRKWNAWKVRWDGRYSYTRSTLTEAKNELNTGKQLIYTPFHRASGAVTVAWKTWSLQYRHNYTGSRFTLQDNSDELPAFQTGTLVLQTQIPFSAGAASAHFRINNIWNADYQVVEFRPMPLVNYEAGVSIKIGKTK